MANERCHVIALCEPAMSALAPSLGSRPAVERGYRLQWEAVQNAHVLLYPEGMIKLNASAGEILKRCDGVKTVADIITDLETNFATTGLSGDVLNFVTMAVENKWLTLL